MKKQLRTERWLGTHMTDITDEWLQTLGLPVEASEALEISLSFFGNNEANALRWLQDPVRGLEYKKPVDLLMTEEGRKKVIELIWKLENGVVV